MDGRIVRPTEVARLGAGPVEYRLERRGPAAVVICHGGHMRAGLALGEEVFAELGCTVLVPSRPGYGRTPVGVGPGPVRFAEVIAELCARLGITEATVVGISGGGPTALALAADHPHLVRRLIMESAVGGRPWPGLGIRVGARVVFAAPVESLTWSAVRLLLRRAPATGLRLMLSSLTTAPVTEVLNALDDDRRSGLVTLFGHMRSGHGFVNDLRYVTPPDATRVRQPALVIAGRTDGQVPYAHAEALAAALPNAELVPLDDGSHFVWHAPGYDVVAGRIRAFLDGG